MFDISEALEQAIQTTKGRPETFHRCINTILTCLPPDRVIVSPQISIKRGEVNKQAPNRAHVFITTVSEEERQALFAAFKDEYGEETMGHYKPLSEGPTNSATGETLVHIDVDALNEIGTEPVRPSDWGVNSEVSPVV